ncbi:MAG: magnesium/cobalt transporter CorA [Syntrophobacteraceae bacterium]
MPRKMRVPSDRVGLPPGSLVYTGEKRLEEVNVTLIEYGPESFTEQVLKSFDRCVVPEGGSTVTWVHVCGIHRVENLEVLGTCFGIHPLILEDIISTEQRPKVEDLDEYLYVLLKHLDYDEARGEVVVEQVSVILGPSYVLSFQETGRNHFAPVIERLRNSRGRLRKLGADYLAYALLDLVVDRYFVVLEKAGYRIEALEEELVGSPDRRLLHSIHHLRREMILLRRSTWPLREAIVSLERRESALIKDTTGIYFRDLYDHTVQVIDTVETYRDILTGMIELYLSSVSNRLNAVMKVLTIIATIFMPLTFLAGVYGMNFKYMPELEWHYGYALVWLVMILVAGAMLAYFKAKRWI